MLEPSSTGSHFSSLVGLLWKVLLIWNTDFIKQWWSICVQLTSCSSPLQWSTRRRRYWCDIIPTDVIITVIRVAAVVLIIIGVVIVSVNNWVESEPSTCLWLISRLNCDVVECITGPWMEAQPSLFVVMFRHRLTDTSRWFSPEWRKPSTSEYFFLSAQVLGWQVSPERPVSKLVFNQHR